MSVESLLGQILDAVTNINPTNSPLSAFGTGESMGSILVFERMNQHRAEAIKRLTDESLNTIGERMWTNLKRIQGYSDEAIEKLKKEKATGTKVELATARMAAEYQAGEGLSIFANAVYDRKDVFGKRGEYYLETYQKAATQLTEQHAKGKLEGFTLNDTLTLAGKKVSEGAYDFIDPELRGTKIVDDLQQMASGIVKLKDALKGSMSDVLDAFEQLTGTSATLMSSARFNYLAKNLSESIRFNGTTVQAIAGASQANQRYMQGTGASQTFSASAGITLANIQAQGLSVEGASQGGVASEYNRQVRMSYTSGIARNYAGAYSFWLESKGLKHNEENRKAFNEAMHGADPQAIIDYIDKNQIARYVSGPTATKMLDQLGGTVAMEQVVKDYKTAYKDAVDSEYLYFAREEDIALSDEAFATALKDRAAVEAGYQSWAALATIEGKEADQIRGTIADSTDKAVAYRRHVMGSVGAENPDDFLQMVNSYQAAINKTTEPAAVLDIVSRIAGMDPSDKGLPALLSELSKHDPATVSKLLRSYVGVNIDPNILPNVLTHLNQLSTHDASTILSSVDDETLEHYGIKRDEVSKLTRSDERVQRYIQDRMSILIGEDKTRAKGAKTLYENDPTRVLETLDTKIANAKDEYAKAGGWDLFTDTFGAYGAGEKSENLTTVTSFIKERSTLLSSIGAETDKKKKEKLQEDFDKRQKQALEALEELNEHQVLSGKESYQAYRLVKGLESDPTAPYNPNDPAEQMRTELNAWWMDTYGKRDEEFNPGADSDGKNSKYDQFQAKVDRWLSITDTNSAEYKEATEDLVSTMAATEDDGTGWNPFNLFGNSAAKKKYMLRLADMRAQHEMRQNKQQYSDPVSVLQSILTLLQGWRDTIAMT